MVEMDLYQGTQETDYIHYPCTYCLRALLSGERLLIGVPHLLLKRAGHGRFMRVA